MGNLPETTMAGKSSSLMMSKYIHYLNYGFRTFVLRQKIPYLFGMVITDKCNLNCFYCESKNNNLYHYSYAQACATIQDAYNRGHRSLYFTGGEPMLWTDGQNGLSDLVSLARDLGFYDIFIFTNGTQPITISGCEYIVTIDGPKEIHNQIRDGTFDLILDHVKKAVTPAIFASITFNKNNLMYLDEYVKEIDSYKLFRGISFNILTHWPEIVAKYGVTGKERIQLLDRLWKLKKVGYPIVLSLAAYFALRNNNFRRPIPQIELGTKDRVYTCCRDIDNPTICANCGYANCVEVSQILALKPSAMLQVLSMVR